MTPHPADVEAFLGGLTDPGQRVDSHELVRLMTDVTGEEPTMWSGSIIGFGKYHYRYATGRRATPTLSPPPLLKARELTLYRQ